MRIKYSIKRMTDAATDAARRDCSGLSFGRGIVIEDMSCTSGRGLPLGNAASITTIRIAAGRLQKLKMVPGCSGCSKTCREVERPSEVAMM